MARLQILVGAAAGLTIELDTENFSIGRDASCNLQLADLKASRRHARCYHRGSRWYLRDLGSANGTWFEGQRISELPLLSQYEFRIGHTILRFICEEEVLDTASEDDDGAEEQDWGASITGLDGSQLLAGTSDQDPGTTNEYLLVLHQVIRRSQNTNTREELFDILDDVAAELLDGDRCAVFLPQADGWRLWPPHERRLRARFGSTPFARTLLAQARLRLEALLCAQEGDLDPSLSMAQAGLRSAMVAPMRIGGEVYGLLYVDRLHASQVFHRCDLEFLEAVANQLAIRLHNHVEVSRLTAEVERLSRHPRDTPEALVGSPETLDPLQAFIAQAAAQDCPVLLLGEAGSGKRDCARRIHAAGKLSEGPLQSFDCSAYDDAMSERILFGQEGGDLDAMRPGLVELAHDGTLYLSAIEQLSAPLQQRLARAVEQGVAHRQGGSTPIDLRFRLIIASSEAETISDTALALLCLLRYRLAPLRERVHDLDLLIEHFIQAAAQGLDQPCRRLSAAAHGLLLGYSWPGNLRQLRNCIEYAMLHASGTVIEVHDLPDNLQQPESLPRSTSQPLISLAEMERRHVLWLLEYCGGNKKAAAELLGIDRSTLYAKLRQYGAH